MNIQKAPYFSHQSKAPFDETIILAGTLAWDKGYHETIINWLSLKNDKKFVILGDEQLEKLPNLQIVRKEKRSARIIQLGELSGTHIALICQSIAMLSRVSTLLLFDNALSLKENLTNYLERIRNNQAVTFAELDRTIQLNESDVSKHFLEYCEESYAYNKETKQFYYYEKDIWKPIDDYLLTANLIKFLKSINAKYTKKQLDNYVALLRYDVPLMQNPKPELMGFLDAVIDRSTGEVSEHSPTHWLLSIIPFHYKNTQKHTPNFDKWLNFVSNNSEKKKNVLLALLYMVLSNRYDWQLFMEITGNGATGKSILTNICMEIIGLDNVISLNLNNLDNPKERYPIKDKLLIICPDQPSYKMIGSGLKAITGGDLIRVEPKYKDPISITCKAVVIIVNNEPTKFIDRSGGIERRRIIIHLSRVVPDNERDLQLYQKIKTEIPSIIQQLLSKFSDNPLIAREILLDHKKSSESLKINQFSDPIVEFCSHFKTTADTNGLFVGNANSKNWKDTLYSAYLAFLKANNLSYKITLPLFAKAMEQGLRQNKCTFDYTRTKRKQGFQTNVHFKDIEEFSVLFIK
ncbi:DNA primase family protein [Otariodibacter oris]|uniref:Putative DNA primase/helicase n=1 Tax=Otariodibacter oris TaxID=1032623 RepID=A0A420XHZ2_9PAST|nr:phage/plasmid primase, P4 family [Otariodibacter oris]QGM80873.1 hypothetical protein A6A10_05395 [Otariodibacter oris]RKR76952.1 putative DNA primase/helicase [Otariodibacter oris]